ncbi:hypothetical protein BSKO_04710 [Bryopsis sp. KO-2023]|nr:hypothetical protein BSKO_04710 [Bryopsis sp. KO-2023]
MESKKGTLRGRSSRFFSFGDRPEDISNEGVYLYYTPQLPDIPEAGETSQVVLYDDEAMIPTNTYALRLGFGWDAEGFDLDASAAMFNAKMAGLEYVWWDHPKLEDESVYFRSKDDKEGIKEGDKEIIGVEIDHIANEVCYVVLCVSVYTKGKTLDDVKSITLRAFDEENGDKELFKYNITEDLRGTSMVVGALVRQGAWFKFVPRRQPLLSRTITELTHEPDNLECVRSLEPVPLQRLMMHFNIKKGRNLTPMDVSLFKKSSDPYLKIFYRGKQYKSEVITGTLHPTFNMKALPIGEVVECDDDEIEVQVWDWDRLTEDDFMGMVRLCVGGIVQKGPGVHDVWLPLTGTMEQKEEGTKITGELNFEFTLVKVDDYDPKAPAGKPNKKALGDTIADKMNASWAG